MTAILANGAFPSPASAARRLLESAERIVCCDGAADKLVEALQRPPDVVVGDMDSSKGSYSNVIHIPDEDTNDLTKAIEYCRKQAWPDLAIFGATGLREDHSLGNIFRALDAQIPLYTDSGCFLPVADKATFHVTEGCAVSVFATDCETRVKSSGLVWPLDNVKFKNLYCATLNRAQSSVIELESTKPIMVFISGSTQAPKPDSPKVQIEESWKNKLADEFNSEYFKRLTDFVRDEYAKGRCYPPGRFIFEAFNRTPFDKVKVVIIGQDPYHGAHQAHGLCFSVMPPTPPPPSLVNIYKELEAEYGVDLSKRSGDLSSWADDGVLLLNSTLTVQEGKPMSHTAHGWERFTDAVVVKLAHEREHLVFMLWGSPARKKGSTIDRSRHLVLETVHPSPLSAYRGFFGCGHFKKANEYLASHGIDQIKWV